MSVSVWDDSYDGASGTMLLGKGLLDLGAPGLAQSERRPNKSPVSAGGSRS